MQGEKPEVRKVVLKLKLGSCLTSPTKRGAADLHEAALLYNRAQTAMVRHWERHCEATLGTVETIHCKGIPNGRLNPKTGKRTAPSPPREIRVLVMPTEIVEQYELPPKFTTELYHVGRLLAPRLSPSSLSLASNTILGAHVNKRTPWNHRGKARRAWQAILAGEAVRPCFREKAIGVANKTTTLLYEANKATLTFALWSNQSGRKVLSPTWRIETRQLPRGLRKIVRQVATKQWKLCDSELVWHAPRSRRGRGYWAFHMCYERPPYKEKHDAKRIATLKLLGGEGERPFEVAGPDCFPWKVSDTRALLVTYRHLEAVRLARRSKYRDAGSGSKGHGRGRIEETIAPVSRAAKALMERYSKACVAEIVRYCIRHDCGTLVFDSPRTKQKAAGWFAQREIPFDWTQFCSRLKYRAWLRGIRVVKDGEKNSTTARTAEPDDGKGVASTVKKSGKPRRR